MTQQAKGVNCCKLLIADGNKANLVIGMCEFNVILKGKTQFKDVVYAKSDGKNVMVKNVLGETKEFKNCAITEVDVNSTRLVLTEKS